MHLAIPFTLLMGYFVAAAPSIQHAQISVEITNMDAQDQVDALHSSEELVMNYADQDHPDDPDWDPENLPFNFTLGVQYVDGSQYGGQYEDLSFGFEDLQADPSVWGKIGFRTEFAFRNGALINGNKALGSHPTHVNPGWTSLWPLKKENEHKIFFLLAWSKNLRGKRHYSLEFSTSGKSLSVASISIVFIHSIFEGAN